MDVKIRTPLLSPRYPTWPAANLKRSLLSLAAVPFMAGCSQLESIPYSPVQTPQTWLSIQPYVQIQVASKTLIIVQPTTTAIVCLLGMGAIGAGLNFLRIRNTQWSRFWWGIALLLWGFGALFAGISYEAFSYQIKCAGRELCTWTSWWEIFYLVFSVGSADAMLVAVAISCTSGKWRRKLLRYACINIALYLVIVVIGILIPA